MRKIINVNVKENDTNILNKCLKRLDFDDLVILDKKLSNTQVAMENLKKCIIKSVTEISQLKNAIKSMISTDYMILFKESLLSVIAIINEGSINPNSYFSYYEYQRKLKEFYWAWPFEISAAELKKLIEQAHNEKEFDKLICSFFNKQRVKRMMSFIVDNLPGKHKMMFRQIMQAYENKYYILINNALMSIIDNLLGSLTFDKKKSMRYGIIHPVIKHYSDNYDINDIYFIFELQMLSNNIDCVFKNYDFKNKNDTILTNKKVSRHMAIHGIKYSNKKTETLMILNTLSALLENMKYLYPFKNSLRIKDGFEIHPQVNDNIMKRTQKIVIDNG